MVLPERFKEYWLAKGYSNGGQAVLLAVSGGKDSMVMADLFLQSKIAFAVAHCNFGLRAAASDLDEKLVSDWCRINELPFHTTKFETKQKSADWKKGTQETARILRYEWFEQIRKEHGYARIVTAHHANDNVETLLINLFRGTGISGLHGIQPENGYVVRPLLFATREMIDAYATEYDIAYREDASNASDDYLRNAVRHNIIPAVTHWFPGAVSNVNDSIARFAEAELLYKKAVAQEQKKLMELRGQDWYIPILKLKKLTAITTICYELLQPFGFTALQVPHVLNLVHVASGRYVASATHRVIRDRDFLIITTLPAATTDLVVIDALPAVIDTARYRFHLSEERLPGVISDDKNHVCIDIKNITFPILLRKWRIGDYFYPLGMKMKKKKVSRLLIDEKVSLNDKEHVWILECSKRIAWVAGMRLDERYKVTAATEKVLVVKRELR
jgi:tRNA(Ile)-lysidine synthase